MNLNKIYQIVIREGKITSISVYIDDLNRYTKLNGYCAPCTSYKIAEFRTEEAIYTILKDIGFEHAIDLNIKNNDCKTYIELANFLSNGFRAVIDGVTFMKPCDITNNINKVTLKENLFVNKVYLNLGTSNSNTKLSFTDYMFLRILWGECFTEEDLQKLLKKMPIVESYDGSNYNHYSSLEHGDYKIIRRVKNTNGDVFAGVFLVNVNDSLLKFRVIEPSYNLSLKKEIPKDAIFFISSKNISHMQ